MCDDVKIGLTNRVLSVGRSLIYVLAPLIETRMRHWPQHAGARDDHKTMTLVPRDLANTTSLPRLDHGGRNDAHAPDRAPNTLSSRNHKER